MPAPSSARPSLEEEAAARRLAGRLGGTWRWRDRPGAPDGTHDFDLDAGGRRIALEVTSEVDRDRRQLDSEVAKRDWSVPELDHNWMVKVRPGCRINDLARESGELVCRLERTGRIRSSATDHDPDDPVQAALVRLGVVGLARLDEAEPGELLVNAVGRGGPTDTSEIHELVSDHIAANAGKLRRADADERHLWIWVDHGLAAAMQSVGGLPLRLPAVPALPEGVDVVWVAEDVERGAVWRLDRSGWVVVQPGRRMWPVHRDRRTASERRAALVDELRRLMS